MQAAQHASAMEEELGGWDEQKCALKCSAMCALLSNSVPGSLSDRLGKACLPSQTAQYRNSRQHLPQEMGGLCLGKLEESQAVRAAHHEVGCLKDERLPQQRLRPVQPLGAEVVPEQVEVIGACGEGRAGKEGTRVESG